MSSTWRYSEAMLRVNTGRLCCKIQRFHLGMCEYFHSVYNVYFCKVWVVKTIAVAAQLQEWGKLPLVKIAATPVKHTPHGGSRESTVR